VCGLYRIQFENATQFHSVDYADFFGVILGFERNLTGRINGENLERLTTLNEQTGFFLNSNLA
jgi:hypothetical protein